MTDSTNDWADKIAMGLVPSYGPPSLVHCHFEKVSTVLRAAELRGRAMGMREAAAIADFSKIITRSVEVMGETIPSREWCRNPTPQEIAEAVRFQADKLNPPNTKGEAE